MSQRDIEQVAVTIRDFMSTRSSVMGPMRSSPPCDRHALKSGLVVFGGGVTRIKIKGLNSLILSYRARLTLSGLFGKSAL